MKQIKLWGLIVVIIIFTILSIAAWWTVVIPVVTIGDWLWFAFGVVCIFIACWGSVWNALRNYFES